MFNLALIYMVFAFFGFCVCFALAFALWDLINVQIKNKNKKY